VSVTSEALISGHAIERFRQRVDHRASLTQAYTEITSMLAIGRVRSRPRHWMRGAILPGTRYVYPADRPGICLIVEAGVVKTVLTKKLYRTPKESE
jgi:hypothetical protein